MNSTHDIHRHLQREGIDSQGLVFVEVNPTSMDRPRDPLGHVKNVQDQNNAVRFVDKTAVRRLLGSGRARYFHTRMSSIGFRVISGTQAYVPG